MKVKKISIRFFAYLVSLTISIFLSSQFSLEANAVSYYVGTIKSPSYAGIRANIEPRSYPNVTGSGESCWVSNVYVDDDGMEWLQTGCRYYDGYSGFRTYVESTKAGVYSMQEIGYHVLHYAAPYKVEYESDGKWHAYISGYQKEAMTFSFSSTTVEAMAEAHSSSIELGPFYFTNVNYKSTSGTWYNMDSTPYADSPFHVDITNNYTYKAY